MTSPNEPGYPPTGDSPNGNSTLDHGGAHRAAPAQAGRFPDTGEAPHQPTPVRTPAPRRSPAVPSPHHETRSPSHLPSADAQPTRFISGAAGSVHSDGTQPEIYASELPDLSGPPRSGQRNAPDRGPDGSARTGQGRSAGSQVPAQVSRRSRGPVRASMQIRRIDPWSMFKVSLLLAVALFFVWMIGVALLYLVLGGMGVWSKLNSNVGDLLNNTSGSTELVSSGTIFGGAALIGLVNIVLLTAMATIAAFVYNLTTDLIGGVEVTLADRD